jgi:hypothetical protein
VWWLSVDNYFGAKVEPVLSEMWLRNKNPLRRRVPLCRLGNYRHYAQSTYAREFLADYGIEAEMLTDYLSAEHLRPRGTAVGRKNIVIYNPKKGFGKTAHLRERNPDLKFVPIQNMSSQQAAELLASAKVYIDFGDHPGKDRLPREAAMAGCCVITGRQGSARNEDDVPILGMYKLDDDSNEYLSAFRPLALDIFEHYPAHAEHFEAYRERIRREPGAFREQVTKLFGVA